MERSINQNAYTGALPNFHNLGIVLRILVAVNLFAVAAAIVQLGDGRAYWDRIVGIGALVEPLLILSVLMLIACRTGSAPPPCSCWSFCSRPGFTPSPTPGF